MYPIPSKVLALLGRDHGVDARLLASVNGSAFVLPLQVVSGSITVDAKSPARRSLSCTVVSSVDEAAVSPLGAEVRAEYGIVDPTSGEVHWVPVGTFVISDAKENTPGIVELTGTDRWTRVVDARFERAVTTSGNTRAAIASLLAGADDRITVDISEAPANFTHRPTIWDRDRDKAIVQLAASIGCVVWFTPMGVAKVAPVPSLGSPPVWTIAGGEGGAKITSSRGVSRSATYNAVAVTGEPGGNAAAVFAVARDSAIASRTRWGGPFGKRTRFMSSTLISTVAQAYAVAVSMLARVSAVARTVTVETVQHPGLDAYDIVAAQIGDGFQRLRVGAFSLTLGLGTMTITALSDTDETEGE